MDTLTRGLLGITGSCARCHDHKFDPIQQLDYYAVAGVFNNTATHRLPLADASRVQRFEAYQQEVRSLQDQINTLQQSIKKKHREATAEEQTQLAEWAETLTKLRANAPPGYDTAHALQEAGDADMYVAVRGNLRKTGNLARRQFFRILSDGEPRPLIHGSGREALAEAIVDPANPLTARVFVNRVWMHHFGEAIVRTPSNFGALGQRPTHPALLDWLAVDFIENGWSLKRLHRQIILSRTYQLSSEFHEASFNHDSGNELLWRENPRRMDVETWRDSLLAVTGELNVEGGGPPVDDIASSNRRTLYAKVSRNGDVFPSDRFLRTFDFPLMRATVAQRPRSIVPQQYLFMLNSPFVVQRARAFVDRLDRTVDHVGRNSPDSDAEKIQLAYSLLYGREPSATEVDIGRQFLASAAPTNDEGLSPWHRYAQVLLSSNEFMFVR